MIIIVIILIFLTSCSNTEKTENNLHVLYEDNGIIHNKKDCSSKEKTLIFLSDLFSKSFKIGSNITFDGKTYIRFCSNCFGENDLRFINSVIENRDKIKEIYNIYNYDKDTINYDQFILAMKNESTLRNFYSNNIYLFLYEKNSLKKFSSLFGYKLNKNTTFKNKKIEFEIKKESKFISIDNIIKYGLEGYETDYDSLCIIMYDNNDLEYVIPIEFYKKSIQIGLRPKITITK